MTTGVPRQLLVIDTDGGIDDAVALWWALAEPGDALVEVLAVTTVWGNVDVEVATGNVCRVLHAGAPRGARGPRCGRPVGAPPPSSACPTSSTGATGWVTPTGPRRPSAPGRTPRWRC